MRGRRAHAADANHQTSDEHRHYSKIDLATAAVIAYDRSTAPHDRHESIYETQGLFILGEDEQDDDAYDEDDDLDDDTEW